jgi:hypothetical protein
MVMVGEDEQPASVAPVARANETSPIPNALLTISPHETKFMTKIHMVSGENRGEIPPLSAMLRFACTAAI